MTQHDEPSLLAWFVLAARSIDVNPYENAWQVEVSNGLSGAEREFVPLALCATPEDAALVVAGLRTLANQ